MVQEVLNPGEIDTLLHYPILEIIVGCIANSGVVGLDLFAPVYFLFAHRAVATKANIITPAVAIVGGYISMNFVAFELVGRPPRRNAAVNRHHEGGKPDVLPVIVFASGDQPDAEVRVFGLVKWRRIAFVQRLIALVGECAM